MNELDWLPRHDCGLHLAHNPHRDVYETVEQYTADFADEWASDAEREKAIREDSLWELQWYPDTPVGFYRIMASSLEALRDYCRNHLSE